ncbi:adenine phosphoribosyltransferase [Hoyosella sp. G463]|uniref:Adenine phosphoribosyltransferase n=1 Tax=Lolliginicoccus lacisalsi TaxID=2742202 RepID=A0A927JA01_9ACTN|nr:adenine phosphoribosyltransferase [Lolliginicoccus lacisalsi]MBD8505318.1 adenine phosphoribosyltransferase [Lolliginicoccus lacisalsi]
MGSSLAALIASLTRTVPDFPAPGVQFADLSPLFADGHGLRSVIAGLAEASPPAASVDLVAGIDSRGFLLGAGVALHLGTGMLVVRKQGKLPPPVHARSYALEYGEAVLEIPAEGIELAGRRVLIIDDVLATGGTLVAAKALLEEAGAEVVGAAVVLELAGLAGRAKLGTTPLAALITQ